VFVVAGRVEDQCLKAFTDSEPESRPKSLDSKPSRAQGVGSKRVGFRAEGSALRNLGLSINNCAREY